MLKRLVETMKIEKLVQTLKWPNKKKYENCDGFFWNFNNIIMYTKIRSQKQTYNIRQTRRVVCSHGQTICNYMQTKQFKNSALHLGYTQS